MRKQASRRFLHRCVPAVVLVACCSAVIPAPAAKAAPAQPAAPTISDLGAGTIYYDGAQLDGTLTRGDPVLYSVRYGPAGGPMVTPTLFNSPSGTGANVAISVSLSQLAPATSYSYTWLLYDRTTGVATTGPSGAFTTAALPGAAATPIVPPANPAANGIYDNCGADPKCLADINGVRAAQENLPPIVLPANWASLTGAEQIFVFTNLERVSRGLAPIPNLVSTYDGQLQSGLVNDADPELPVPP